MSECSSRGDVLCVRDLRKSYRLRTKGTRVEALRGVGFTVRKGEIFGIIGENGAGKSTFVECVLGSRDCDSGSVQLLGMNPVRAPRAVKRALFNRVGVQFQATSFQNKIRVGEACETSACLYARPADWKSLLETFSLSELRNRDVASLSGGQKQKLAIVLALIPQPEIVFLDELTTGLDPKARRMIWDTLKKLQADGLTIILTSHYMEEVEYLCDRVCVLKSGEIVALGTPSTLVASHGVKNLEDVFLNYMDADPAAADGGIGE